MKRLLLLLALVTAAWAQVSPGNHTFCQAAGSCTTPAIDGTGATVIVGYTAEAIPGGVPMTDSMGNVYTALTEWRNPPGAGHGGQMFCKANPVVSNSMTFTNPTYGSLAVMAFTGTTRVSCPDAQDGSDMGGTVGVSVFGGPNGLATATIPNSLWVSGAHSEGTVGTVNVDQGTIVENHPTVSSPFEFGIYLAWGTTSGTVNPFWGFGGSGTRGTAATAIFNLATSSAGVSPTAIPANHPGNITLSLVGTGTTWNSTTRFTISGSSGATCPTGCTNSPVVTDATHVAIVVTTGSAGTLTITESVTGSNVTSTVVGTEVLSISPSSGATGAIPSLTLTATNTLWTHETPAGLFTVSGGSGASITTPTITTDTAGTATLTVGSAAGALTVTDTATGATATFTALAITSLAASGNSPNSILLVWTTNVNTNSQASCGTVSGGPYIYTSPTVDPVKTGADDYFGVTEHSLAVVVPTTNTSSTAYYCRVTVVDSSGHSATSTEVHSGTNAALTNTPFTVVTGPQGWIRYNDQATGANGAANTGKAYRDDSFLCAWASDGNNYCSLNDGAGTSTDGGATYCCDASGFTASGAVQLSSNAMTITMRGNTTGHNSTGFCCSGPDLSKPTTYTADGLRSYVEGMQCARGTCGIFMPRAGTPQCTPIVLSKDGFMTTIAPQNNTGPSVTGSTFTGAGQGTWGYPTVQGQCSLTTYVTGRQFGFAQDWGGTPPTVGHPSYQFPVTHQAGTDAWIYSYTYTSGVENFGIMRSPLNNSGVTENGKVIAQMYNGTGHGADGLNDASWVNVGAGVGRMYNEYPLGRRASLAWIGGNIKRWVLIGFLYTPAAPSGESWIDGSAGLAVWDVGPYPWAILDAVPVGFIPGDPNLEPSFGPVMAQILESTCQYPADGSVLCMVACTGNYLNAGTIQYGPHYRWVHFVPRAQAITPAHTSWFGTKTTHISNGLDALWVMDMPTWSTFITDYSPPRASKPNGYLVTGITAQLAVNDGRGLKTGWPQAGSITNPTTVTVATPYTVALTNFTIIATFMHDGNLAAVTNETVLDKVDLQIKRNGSTANSWVVKVGGVTSSAFSLPTDGGFATLIIRRVGATVTLYSSAGIASNGRFTALTTISLSGDIGSGALGSNTLTLGSLAAATQPFYGTISEIAIFSRALSDPELISEVAATRFDMSTRNPVVTLP